MNEQQNYDPTKSWRDVSKERIDDPVKAEHMARVEDKWRTFAKESAQLATAQLEVAKDPNTSTSDAALHTLAQQVNSENARSAVTFEGPRAVEATGQTYDQLQNPELPPELPSPQKVTVG